MIRLFLDANILIDITDSDRKTSVHSIAFINRMFDHMEKYQLYTSCDLITTIFYVIRKELGVEKALQQIKTMNKFITIIEFGNEEIADAIELMEKYEKYTDLEDTIQYVIAKREKCDYIITNDKKFASGDLPVLSSEEALREIE